MNNLSLNYTGPVSAILLNYGDDGYAKVHFDKRTLDNLENNLSKIRDGFSRTLIWNQLWYNVMDE